MDSWVAVLWKRDFNERKGILTPDEVEGKIRRYEASSKYKGIVTLSEYIKQIGIQKAIEMYIHDARGLMRAAGIEIKPR